MIEMIFSDYCKDCPVANVNVALAYLPDGAKWEASCTHENACKRMLELRTEKDGDRAYDPDEPIENLDLSVRSGNCLARHGVKSLGELAGMTYEELTKVRNMGQKSVKEIVAKARERGIIIKLSTEDRS